MSESDCETMAIERFNNWKQAISVQPVEPTREEKQVIVQEINRQIASLQDQKAVFEADILISEAVTIDG
jgi:hypothetical protein